MSRPERVTVREGEEGHSTDVEGTKTKMAREPTVESLA